MKTGLRFITVLLLAIRLFAQNPTSTVPKTPSQLSLSDARILVYLTPAAKQVRKTGVDVFMEQSTSDKINQKDYYVFQMLSTRECDACSANVGYFAVNKHTADVRDFDADDQRLLTSKEMAGVQHILKDAHYITADVIKQYRNSPVWAESQ